MNYARSHTGGSSTKKKDMATSPFGKGGDVHKGKGHKELKPSKDSKSESKSKKIKRFFSRKKREQDEAVKQSQSDYQFPKEASSCQHRHAVSVPDFGTVLIRPKEPNAHLMLVPPIGADILPYQEQDEKNKGLTKSRSARFVPPRFTTADVETERPEDSELVLENKLLQLKLAEAEAKLADVEVRLVPLPPVTTVARQAEAPADFDSEHDEAMAVEEGLESMLVEVDTEMAADRTAKMVEQSENVYAVEMTRNTKINTTYDGNNVQNIRHEADVLKVNATLTEDSEPTYHFYRQESEEVTINNEIKGLIGSTVYEGNSRSSESVDVTPSTSVYSHQLNTDKSHLKTIGTSLHVLPKDYFQLIEDLGRTLAAFKNLKCPVYCPSPDDYHKLLIQDPLITEAMDAIEILRQQYPGYTILTSDLVKPLKINSGKKSLLPNYTSSLYSDNPKMPCHVSRTMLHDYHNKHISTVGAFVEDAQPVSSNLVLGVTAAHAILNEEEMGLIGYARGPDYTKRKTMDLMMNTVIGRIQYTEDVEVFFPDSESAPVQDRVYVASTQYIRTPEFAQPALPSYQKFLFDIALLPVDLRKLHPDLANDRDERNFVLSSLPHPERLCDEGTRQQDTTIEGYIQIEDDRDIQRLVEADITIECEHSRGKLAIPPMTLGARHRKWMIAPHFAFTLPRKPLVGGNSGSPLLVYNKDKKVYHVIGIFIGRFKGTKQWSKTELYQATPYGPALKQLEFLYDKLGNVRPVGSVAGGLPLNDSLLRSLARYTV